MSGFKNEAEGYAASLRQMGEIVSGWDLGGDPDELLAAADFIERQQAKIDSLQAAILSLT